MVSGYLLLTILVIILYYFVREHEQFSATASAIQQIWSGTCRLSCRQSNYSRCSGLSGLPRPIADHSNTSRATSAASAAPNSRCICHTCPCKLIKDVLNKCSPATRLCTDTTDLLASYFYNAIKTLVELYNYMNRVFECSAECQTRSLELDGTSNRLTDTSPPSELEIKERRKEKKNLQDGFARTSKDKESRTAVDSVPSSSFKTSKTGSSSTFKAGTKSSTSFKPSRKVSRTTTHSASRSESFIKPSRKDQKNTEGSEDLRVQNEPSLILSSESCPTCVKNDKVCIGGCPNIRRNESK